MADRLQPLYNFLPSPPDLTDVPLPTASLRTQKGSVVTHSGTIDASRGCPFSCSFCSIINVQGRTMRARSAARIIDRIGENYRLKGRRRVRHYFFTDDNFARNPHWEEIFDGLIRLREKGAADIDFMMQVDTQASKIPRFVEKAARAGCVQVFIGMESVRDDNLKAGGKPQNKAAEYREMVARWHEVGVVCHAGFIIGLPYDTRERVMEDVRTLSETMLVDQASFFMLTPIPGSRDHRAAVEAGVALDPDYNNYDSFHATSPHPRMSREEWEQTFRDAWTEFYSFEHMRRSLLAQNPHTYWAAFKNLIWYRAAMIEGTHPMVTGFFRLKDRKSRRSTFPTERRWPFFKRRVREVGQLLLGYVKLGLEMKELWLLTRIRRDDYWFLGDLRGLGPRSVQAVKLAWGRVHAAIGLGLASVQERLGVAANVVSATLTERLDAVRDTLGSRAEILRLGMAERVQAVRARIDASLASAGKRRPDPAHAAHAVRAALANLRLPELPPVHPPSFLRRRLKRLNPFSLDRLEYDPALSAYWRRTRRAVARWQLWRLNPLLLTWNLVRGARQALIFLVALGLERY